MSSSEYPIGYSSTIINAFKNRKASEKAQFLIPYLKETDDLLDCGCGPGSMTLDFAALLKRGRVFGFDIEQSQVAIANDSKRERSIDNAEFQVASILDIPFSNQTFDVAFVHAVLWTLSDPLLALKELHRVIKPGGIIACREPCMDSVIYFPFSDWLEMGFKLQFQAQEAMGCDRFIGRKLVYHFSHIGLQDIKLSVSSDVFATPKKREQFAEYSIEAWNDAPWAHYIRKEQWACEEEIRSIQNALLSWKDQEGAFISAPWCEALGYAL